MTWSCYYRQPLLGTAARRDLLLTILEEVRHQYRFVVHGCVVTPEHVHLLITEPEVGDPSVVMKIVKQAFARRLKKRQRREFEAQGQLWKLATGHVWQKRFYDFNVWSERKRSEKLRYMHRNPVKRGLVEQPDQWKWSSFRSYSYGERGPRKLSGVGSRDQEPSSGKVWKWSISASPTHSQTTRMSGAPSCGLFTTATFRFGTMFETDFWHMIRSVVPQNAPVVCCATQTTSRHRTTNKSKTGFSHPRGGTKP
jgi:putative transposase